MNPLHSRLTLEMDAVGATFDPAAMLAFGQPEGVEALLAPCSLGLWMGASEAGEPLIFLIARRREGSPFDPELDLDRLGGPLWDAISHSPNLEPRQRKARAWETWTELFEGLAPRLLDKQPAPERSMMATSRTRAP